jgi:hypothetical protein
MKVCCIDFLTTLFAGCFLERAVVDDLIACASRVLTIEFGTTKRVSLILQLLYRSGHYAIGHDVAQTKSGRLGMHDEV